MLQLRPWNSLSGGDHGWLKARHHFAIDEHMASEHGPLGCLVVWNDDEVAPGKGFPMHGHHDMEIVTYVSDGAVAHTDDAGGSSRIEAGHVQAISAGRGIRHAEYNPGAEPLRIFQIWLLPRGRGATPHWATKPFPKAERAGRFVPLASGFAEDRGALPIDADARVLGATLPAGQHVEYRFHPMRHGYLVPALGTVAVNGHRIGSRDGIAISSEPVILVSAIDDAEIVFVDAG